MKLNPDNCVSVACIGDTLWITLAPYRYVSQSGICIEVPKGFETDGASVPRMLWAAIPPTGLHFNAAVVHDFLYRSTAPDKPTKEACDQIFCEIMHRDGVPIDRREAMHEAVRLFGGPSYVCGRTAAPEVGISGAATIQAFPVPTHE